VQQEPHLALDGGVDGLDIYRKRLQEVRRLLQPAGWWPWKSAKNRAREVTALAAAAGLTVQKVLQDYAGLDRMVLAAKEGSSYEDYILGLKK
jgi:release factor glutamine methyltransferase